MDIVHHTLIGGAVYLTASSNGYPEAGAAFVVGSVFPDLDVFFMLFGKRFYLKHHQAITHSVFLSPLYAIIIISPLIYLLGFDLLIFLAALFGIWLHIVLDLLNTFRISILSPYNRKRFSFDSLFFIDSVALTLTGIYYIAAILYRSNFVFYAYSVIFAAYIVFKVRLHNRVTRDLKPSHAIPSSLNPFEFYILEEDGEGLTTYLYNSLSKKSKERIRHGQFPEKYHQLADKSTVYKEMQKITRALHITDVIEESNYITITASDLAVRNFGGKFGRTLLKFDNKGGLIHESANV